MRQNNRNEMTNKLKKKICTQFKVKKNVSVSSGYQQYDTSTAKVITREGNLSTLGEDKSKVKVKGKVKQ